MAKKFLFLHIGPSAVDLDAMRAGLELGGVALPEVSPEALTHADLEIRRDHKSAGLKRKNVEGAWAKVVRKVFKTKSDCFLSLPGFFDTTDEQAALAYDGLAGLKVILVLTTGFEVEPPAAWTRLVKPERVHVLPADLSEEDLSHQVARIALVEQQVRVTKRLKKVSRRLAA